MSNQPTTDDLNLIETVFDNSPTMLCLIDGNAKIIKANKEFRNTTNWEISHTDKPTGIGDIFGCINALSNENGCGFSTSCNECKIKLSLITAYTTCENISNLEVKIPIQKNGTRDDILFKISISRIEIANNIYVLLSLVDITKSRRTEQEHEVLNEIIRGVTSTSNLDELLKLIHESIKKIIYAENCFIALKDEKSDLFNFPYFVDQYDEVPPPTSLGRSCTAYVFRTKTPLLLDTDLFDKLVAAGEVELIGSPSPSWLGVPLQTPTKTIGVLVVQHYSISCLYLNSDVSFLHSICSQVAAAIESKRMEDALKKERRLLKTLIDNIPDSIYSKDINCNKTLANKADVMNADVKNENELIGKNDFDFYEKELAEKFFRDDMTVINTGLPILNREEYVLNNQGDKKWLLTSKIPLKDEEDNVIGLVGIGRDITLRKRYEEALNESENRLNVIIESTLDGILAVDGNGKIIRTNKRFAELWRIPQSIIEEGNDELLLACVLEQLADPNEFITKVQELYSTNKYDLDTIYFKDGRVFERYTAPMVSNESSIGRVWSFRDITERERAEQALKEVNEELILSKNTIEDSLFERNQIISELSETKDKLEKLNSEKDKFFSIIAHDLKSPFQGFINLTELMAEDINDFTLDELTQLSKEIHKNSKNLFKLLQNLLEWAQMQKGTYKWEPQRFNLFDTITENIEVLKNRADQKGIILVMDCPNDIFVFADIAMINSVFRNLLSNALKFTNHDGKVTISASIEKNQCMVAVKDSGIGMTEIQLSKLFKIEEKVGQIGTDGEESTGLGLLLCKEFVEKNGGSISVESKIDCGSTFKFTLPLTIANA